MRTYKRYFLLEIMVEATDSKEAESLSRDLANRLRGNALLGSRGRSEVTNVTRRRKPREMDVFVCPPRKA